MKLLYLVIGIIVIFWIASQFLGPVWLFLGILNSPSEAFANSTAFGVIFIVVPILLAFPINWFLNVKRTTTGGTIEVKGFWDYIGHGVANLCVSIVLCGSILFGLYLVFLG